ncbi:DUF6338 family protein [Arthrobacter sp. TMS2-4]
MSLDSLAAIISFLLIIAPGSIWELRRSRFHPGVKETALIEIARITLVSLTATSTAIAVTAAGLWLPIYREAQASGVDPLESSVSSVPVVIAAVITAAIACFGTYIVALIKWGTQEQIEGIRVWHRYFVNRRPHPKIDPVLTVELVEETVWKGPLLSFDSDPEDSQRWLSLQQPMRRKRKGEEKFTRIATEFVLLPESQIKSIQLAYTPLNLGRASVAAKPARTGVKARLITAVVVTVYVLILVRTNRGSGVVS